ncbi:MAG: retropepsin-like aspartic protease [Blastocatellia bacterium]
MTITSQASSRKAAEIRLPFEQYHWLIFLSGCVNSSEPFLFISDTGASITVINETRATALGLTLRDKQRIASADGGEGAMSFVFAKGVTLDLVSAQFASAQVGGGTLLALAEKLLGHPNYASAHVSARCQCKLTC